MPIKPLGDKIVVKQVEVEEKTEGGIIFLQGDGSQQPQGTIIAVGPGKQLLDGSHYPPQVKVGEKVVFSAYANGNPIEVDGEKYLVMDETQILAVLD